MKTSLPIDLEILEGSFDPRVFARVINISDWADSTGNRKRAFKSSHAYRLGESFGVEWYALLHTGTHTRSERAVRYADTCWFPS